MRGTQKAPVPPFVRSPHKRDRATAKNIIIAGRMTTLPAQFYLLLFQCVAGFYQLFHNLLEAAFTDHVFDPAGILFGGAMVDP